MRPNPPIAHYRAQGSAVGGGEGPPWLQRETTTLGVLDITPPLHCCPPDARLRGGLQNRRETRELSSHSTISSTVSSTRTSTEGKVP